MGVWETGMWSEGLELHADEAQGIALPSHSVCHETYFNPFTPKSGKFKTEEEIVSFVLQNCQKQTRPLERTVRVRARLLPLQATDRQTEWN